MTISPTPAAVPAHPQECLHQTNTSWSLFLFKETTLSLLQIDFDVLLWQWTEINWFGADGSHWTQYMWWCCDVPHGSCQRQQQHLSSTSCCIYLALDLIYITLDYITKTIQNIRFNNGIVSDCKLLSQHAIHNIGRGQIWWWHCKPCLHRLRCERHSFFHEVLCSVSFILLL